MFYARTSTAFGALLAATVIFSPNFAKSSDLLDGLNDPAPTQGVKVNWSGFYLGGRLGYGNANHELSLHDYFKDFCAFKGQAADPSFDPFEDDIDGPGIPAGIPARAATLENVKDKVPFVTGTDCETLDAGFAPYEAGFATTVDGQSREIASFDGVNSSGVTGGGQIGYDHQMGRWVFGVFGSYDFSNMDTKASLFGTNVTLIEKGDEWDAGVRAGLLLGDRTMLYLLAAYTETEYTFSGLGANGGDKDVNFSGVKVGGGLEHALTHNVFIGIEGTHTFYGEEKIFDAYDADSNVGFRVNDDLGETKIMGTLKIKLNSDLF